LRATTIAGVILAVMAMLALAAVNEARHAAQQGRRAAMREREARRNLYAADMNLAQRAWEAGNVSRMVHLLEAYWPRSGQEDLRGFEWRYLWRLSQRGDARFTVRGHTGT